MNNFLNFYLLSLRRYVNWLSLVHAGLKGLEFYSPDMNKWRQAHMQARHAIMRLLKEKNVVSIEKTSDNAIIHLDRSKLFSEGVPAVGEFLHQISMIFLIVVCFLISFLTIIFCFRCL